jgi:hypothetical protein
MGLLIVNLCVFVVTNYTHFVYSLLFCRRRKKKKKKKKKPTLQMWVSLNYPSNRPYGPVPTVALFWSDFECNQDFVVVFGARPKYL